MSAPSFAVAAGKRCPDCECLIEDHHSIWEDVTSISAQRVGSGVADEGDYPTCWDCGTCNWLPEHDEPSPYVEATA